MSEQPIKLTDARIDMIADALRAFFTIRVEVGEDLVGAIRALRDRAKAVVRDADRPIIGGEDEPDVEIGKKLIDVLREVLP